MAKRFINKGLPDVAFCSHPTHPLFVASNYICNILNISDYFEGDIRDKHIEPLSDISRKYRDFKSTHVVYEKYAKTIPDYDFWN